MICVYSINMTALSVNVLYFTFSDNMYWNVFNPYYISYLPRVLIHGIYSATTDVNLPHFDLFYISIYNNNLLYLSGFLCSLLTDNMS